MFALTRVSGNAKTGPIPTSMTAKQSCPTTCPFMNNGCYAANGPTNIHWSKIGKGERGVDADQFLREVAALPTGTLFRHNVAGDLPHENGMIDDLFLTRLTKATKRLKGFTYTHHLLNDHNVAALQKANKAGFTVNVSANSVHEVAEYAAKGLPVVCVMPMDAPNVQVVDGVKIVACPAEKSDKVQCANCGICADAKRDYAVGFRAHGSQKKKAEIIARG